MNEMFMTVKDVAKMLDRCGEAVRGYERQGRLPAIRTTGGTRLFRLSDVEAFKAQLQIKPLKVGSEAA